MNNYAYLGLVQRGRFKPLATDHDIADSLRLTAAPINTQSPPESDEVSLVQYEGSVILVRGFDREEWIYSAIVIEQAGLILTAVAQQVFAPSNHARPAQLKFPLA